jgi:hypothetical protein
VAFHEEAKSVKHLHKFSLEKDKIFNRMFYCLNNSDYLLDFQHEIMKNKERIEFLLKYDCLFRRDSLGKRKSINAKVLKEIIMKNPFHLLKHLLSKYEGV